MVELIGDDCQPSTLTIPVHDTDTDGARVGSIKISGSKIWFWNGSDWDIVTSA